MPGITRRAFAASSVAAATSAFFSPARAQAYPARPVTLIVPWGAGGGTDATARIIATLLQQELGQPFNVVNLTGGSGVIGHAEIVTAPPDGYTIGMITVEIAMLHWQAVTHLTPRNFMPLALMNEDPPGIQVAASSPYKTVKELTEALKLAPPGRFKASGTGQGGIWHLALVGWMQALGLPANQVTWSPSNGAAPAMQDLVAGSIDLTTCSVPEARATIEAGQARSLAIMAHARNPSFPDVPTLKEALGVDYSTSSWRGIAGPKGLPPEIATRLTGALKTVYDSAAFKNFMTGRGFGTVWRDASGFQTFMDEADSQMGQAMKAAGFAKA
ncbi:tripartite tricarboxylate transporter substrate binding protein [Bradyrhizobium guangzhouense]|uniref:Tripartite tricarboxylate transporter substrate binding protein n=1 Tax=Bradyrhizobium guangzhouense TaxID=1325095 RepID=A0AAE5X3Q9_9BRAD|nr:tripartite tricarboxylate transporter substrate binding protein [Bradyrhizobium guangzhouense]QAU48088.1 tripartite tricarboxylate transporter substrate binding protein [Bradyrhizobium guangzhouense]RXH10686.1 tripartite tricarboxylate transporter substrate binding protein [Bradyrhizobium guangzhouense]